MRIPKETVDAIYAAADIVEIVQDYVPLKKRGTNYWGLSPFKAERTPSFSVSPNKQIFKDFSSGKGGNAVAFLMEVEGFSYVEALRHIAQKYGIPIPETDDGPAERDTADVKASLLALNKWAAAWFAEQLATDEGRSIGAGYFRERGFSAQTVQQFQLGYSPDQWTALTDAAQRAQFALDYLRQSGLTIENDEGRRFDRFRGRVIFPLFDATGRVVGFAGRILRSDAKAAKYVNSPESPVYNKSALLYGLHLARQAVRDAGVCILVEGYMDVIALHQAGVRNTVASSGTSLTQEQVRLIGRYAKEVLIAYDGDAAGVQAALRAVDLLLEGGLTPRIVQLPAEHDPDSYVKAHGGAAFQEYAQSHAQDFIGFQLRQLAGGTALPDDPARQAQILTAVAQTLARIHDDITRGLYVRHAATRLGLDEQLVVSAVNREVLQQARQVRSAPAPAEAAPPDMPPLPFVGELEKQVPPHNPDPGAPTTALRGTVETYHQEREILRLMLNYPEGQVHPPQGEEGSAEPLFDFLEAELGNVDFAHAPFQHIRAVLLSAWRQQRPLPVQELASAHGEVVAQLVSELLSSPYVLSDNWMSRDVFVPPMDADLSAAARSAVLHLQHKIMLQLIRENQRLLQHAAEPAEQMRLLQRKRNLDARRRELAAQLGIVV